MRVTVIGVGNVGATLGRRFAEHHDVVFGVRDRAASKAVDAAATAGADVDTVGGALEAADVVVLAVPPSAIADLAPALRDGVPVVDASNALAGVPGGHASVAHHLKALVGSVPVAKAFNTIGWEVMANPAFGDRRAVLPVAGDDDARRIAIDLATDIGFDALDLGGLEAAPLVESFAAVWIRHMRRGGGRDFAFARVER